MNCIIRDIFDHCIYLVEILGYSLRENFLLYPNATPLIFSGELESDLGGVIHNRLSQMGFDQSLEYRWASLLLHRHMLVPSEGYQWKDN